MSTPVQASRLAVRRCRRCGGPATGRAGRTCTACGCDFRARPPMSYAQMEGIETAPETAPERPEPAVSTDDLIGRRLWVAFAVSLLAILAVGMAASFVA